MNNVPLLSKNVFMVRGSYYDPEKMHVLRAGAMLVQAHPIFCTVHGLSAQTLKHLPIAHA